VSSIILSRIWDVSFMSNGYVFPKVQNIVKVLLPTVHHGHVKTGPQLGRNALQMMYHGARSNSK
jgi:hypothetical protein